MCSKFHTWFCCFLRAFSLCPVLILLTIWSNKLRPDPGSDRPDWGWAWEATCCCCWGGGWVKLGCCWAENVVWYRSLSRIIHVLIIKGYYSLFVIESLLKWHMNDFSYWMNFEIDLESSEIFLAVVFWIWWLELQKSHLSMTGARDKSVPVARLLLGLSYSWIMCQIYFIILFLNLHLSTHSINQRVNEKM